MYPLPLARAPFSHSLLGIVILFQLFILSTFGATFDAKDFFVYVDESCKDLNTINNAGDDMNALIKAGQDAFNWTPLRKMTFSAFFGRVDPTLDIDTEQNSGLILTNFNKLSTNMVRGKYSLYCDGSAMKWVLVEQEGANKGNRFSDGRGPRWYVPADRRADQKKAFYIMGTQRGDYCQDPEDKTKTVLGASVPGQPYIILCPGAFAQKYKTLNDVKDTDQQPPTNLNDMTSTGAVMLHEFTHAILKTTAKDGIYGSVDCITTAANPATAYQTRKNADSFMLFAMANYLEQNSWVLFGFAQDKNAFNQPNPPSRRTRRRRLLDLPLYPRSNSTNSVAIGSLGTASSSYGSFISTGVFNSATSASGVTGSAGTLSGTFPTTTSSSVGTKTTRKASTGVTALDLATEAIFPIPTDPPMPTQSFSWLSSVIVNMYTASISYNGTTAGPATSTAAGRPASPSKFSTTGSGKFRPFWVNF